LESFHASLQKFKIAALIKGGNHSQFGYLGKLLMDNSADISLEEQQKQTVENILEFLNEIKNGVVNQTSLGV